MIEGLDELCRWVLAAGPRTARDIHAELNQTDVLVGLAQIRHALQADPKVSKCGRDTWRLRTRFGLRPEIMRLLIDRPMTIAEIADALGLPLRRTRYLVYDASRCGLVIASAPDAAERTCARAFGLTYSGRQWIRNHCAEAQ